MRVALMPQFWLYCRQALILRLRHAFFPLRREDGISDAAVAILQYCIYLEIAS